MTRNKPRLQLALYARPKHHARPHYALFMAAKDGSNITKHHVKNTLQNLDGAVSQPWRYESIEIPDVMLEQRLLVRVIVAKVATSRERVRRILESVPVYQVDDLDRENAAVFNCVSWVRSALVELKRQGVVTRLEDWEEVQRKTVEYMEEKKGQGRWNGSWKGGPGVPLMDLIDGKELVE